VPNGKQTSETVGAAPAGQLLADGLGEAWASDNSPVPEKVSIMEENMSEKGHLRWNLYTIRDKIAEESGAPFLAVNDGVAGRNYRHLLEEETSRGLRPEEYQLLRLASWNAATSTLLPYPLPVDVTPVVTAPVVEVDHG